MRKMNRWTLPVLAVLAAFLLVPRMALGGTLTVLTVPFVPANPTTPHTTYPTSGTTEATVILVATVPSAVGSADAFTYSWNFGDGSPVTAPAAVTNPYDISVTHQYPASAATGTAWTAVVTVTDTTNPNTGTANYFITQSKDTLSARVNVAIDWGLAYMHRTMWRKDAPANGQTVNWGGWDLQSQSCTLVDGTELDCGGPGVENAENVQAFEVSGHTQNGPATDPYTDDVYRGINRMTFFLGVMANATDTYKYNPATVNYTCADGSVPTTGDRLCASHGGQHFYNAGATSCTAPPCVVTYDGNGDGKMVFSNDNSGEPIYTSSPFLDALVASATPAATAQTGPVAGMSYKDIVQDLADYYAYSQYFDDVDLGDATYAGFTRGGGYSASGGAWLYGPQQGDDDSTSQWAAIGLIGANRGFGLPLPVSIQDFNNVWITNAQDLQDPAPTGPDSVASGDNQGAYGYRGSFFYSNAWGPFAVTPSAMVQMALDGIGRTKNVAFGDATTDFDQRWNTTESYYADNFCNSIGVNSGAALTAPRRYMYGMFSFTKSMLLHDPSGSLTPIQFLRTMTPGVFSNPADPPNTIDWYSALSAANGGNDPCDGVAQTLVSLQMPDGEWYGNSYDGAAQQEFETAWALIMLQKTVFVSCINNLYGRGTPGGGGVNPRVDLTWAGQTSATGYTVLRSTTNGSGYVPVGSTNGATAFSDRTAGLVNGGTFYYVVQPINGTTEICQSNQATVKIPTR